MTAGMGEMRKKRRDPWRGVEVGRAKEKVMNEGAKPAKGINRSREKENVTIMKGLEKCFRVTSREKFILPGRPVGSRTIGMVVVIGLGAYSGLSEGKLGDGDIDGNNTWWRMKTAMLRTVDGNVSWPNVGREVRLEKASGFPEDMVRFGEETIWRLIGCCFVE
jgi:hypothetical protein